MQSRVSLLRCLALVSIIWFVLTADYKYLDEDLGREMRLNQHNEHNDPKAQESGL